MRVPLILIVALALFIAAGLMVENRMAASSRNLTRLIAKAESHLIRGRFTSALNELHRFERRWSRVETYWGLLTDHQEIDQVRLATGRADRYLAAHSLPDARAELCSLRFLVDHIPKKEALSAKSVL